MARQREPSCRVCGCTEHKACPSGCSWVRVAMGEAPLCSACSGTPKDAIETAKRISTIWATSGRRQGDIGRIARALARRVRDRIELEDREAAHA